MNGTSGHIDAETNGISGHEHYSRTPDSVLCNKKLSAISRCVFAFIAGKSYQGSTAKVGQRFIANSLGFHQETVGLAIEELVEHKHLKIIGDGNRRRTYVLASNVFGQKQRAGVEETAAAPSGGRRLVSAPRKKIG